MEKVKVTIIIPNYNHARYLSQRLDSVLGQTYQNFELLLLDDCSPDDSRRIIEEYAARDSRIQIVYNEQNSGSTFKQWNKGIALAQGEYVWLAESDDYAHPDLLAELVARLEANSAVGLAYCDSFSVDEVGTILGKWNEQLELGLATDKWKQDFEDDGLVFIRQFLAYVNVIPNASAVLLRRSLLTQVGPAEESMRLAGDWMYWIKILAKSRVSYNSKAYNYFRTHKNNVRSVTETNGILLEESARVLLLANQVAGSSERHKQAMNKLVENWFYLSIYGNIPIFRQKLIVRTINKLHGDQGTLLMKKSLQFLVGYNLRGLRMLLGDGLLYKYFRKQRTT